MSDGGRMNVGEVGLDPSLIDAARAGDRAAFARIYEFYAPIVHAVLLARVKPADADDLTQEVFVNAMRAIGDLRDPAALGGWLCTAARNRAASFHRAPRMTPLDDRDPEALKKGAGSLEMDEVLAKIRALPEAAAELLIMRLVEGLTGPQIALRTGASHSAVRVALHRGMEMLRARLRESGAHP